MSNPVITIDFTADLGLSSDLRNLISPNGSAILQLGSSLTQHAGQPISSAIGVSSPALELTASPTWTAGPVSFSLTPNARCTIAIANLGEPFEIAQTVSDTASTQDVQLTAVAGITYINVDLDFEATGSVAGCGAAFGVSISGKASGCATTTLSFCQPVPSNTETLAALKMALSQLVFPTAPDSLLRMVARSSCRMNFDGAVNLELDLSYGLADYKLSAPSAALVHQSLGQVVSAVVALPAAEFQAGITAGVTYAHTDHFGLVVTKPDADTAFLYLIRSAGNESGASAGITIGVTTRAVSVTADPAQIQQTVQSITGSSVLAANVLKTIAPRINDIESAALEKLNSDAGFSVALARQTGRTVLFNYTVDLAKPKVAIESWGALLTRNVADAKNIAGFTLRRGSGVAAELQKSATLQFHFFNLYKYSSVTKFFDNCSSELEADGSIRLIFDIGIEGVLTRNQAVNRVRFHFVATATQGALANIGNAEIDLNIEISEKGDSANAMRLANILTTIGQPSLPMNAYAQSNSGTLNLVAILKPSACARLQTNDQANWAAIQQASITLLGLDFLKPWTYADWGHYNSICNTGHSGAQPDRRNSGNPNAVPPSFWGNYRNQAGLISYFFLASAAGMNVFEDVHNLANDFAKITTDAEWKLVQQRLEWIVRGDVNIDYSKPIAAALLSRAAQNAAELSVATAQASDASSFTATLTLA